MNKFDLIIKASIIERKIYEKYKNNIFKKDINKEIKSSLNEIFKELI